MVFFAQPQRATGDKRRFWRLGLRCVLLACCCCAALGQPNEAQIKAAIIFNFAQFVEWPTNEVRAPSEPFVIGVVGAQPVAAALEELTQGESVRSRKIEVRAVRTPSQCVDVRILFMSATEVWRWPEFRRALNRRPVLTVSDAPEFARRGGMLELFKKENKFRFRANPAEAKRVELVLSSKLLRLAEIVETDTD